MTLDVITIDFKEYAILYIETPVAVILRISLNTLAIFSPVFQRIYYPSYQFDVYVVTALLQTLVRGLAKP